jgi:uncharacterized membrane protein
MYLDRPKIKLTLKPIDEWLESLAIMGCVWLWIYCIRSYFILPETIPTHFNLKGVADAYGSKANMFILPSIGTTIYLLITLLNRYPHIFNYMVKITADNAETQYRFATRMFRVVKLFVIVLFGIVCIMVTDATNDAGLSRWLGTFLPIILALFTVNTLGFVYISTKTKRTA